MEGGGEEYFLSLTAAGGVGWLSIKRVLGLQSIVEVGGGGVD